MNIHTYINTLCAVDELKTINNLLNSSLVAVSFWGKRMITVANFKGTMTIDELTNKIFQLGKNRCNLDDLTTEERIAGIEITKKLKTFYRVTDTKILEANWFTRILNFIREFSLFTYTIRFEIESDSIEGYFRGYSENKFKSEFGGIVIGGLYEYENSDGSFGSPLRIKATEAAIRALPSTDFAQTSDFAQTPEI